MGLSRVPDKTGPDDPLRATARRHGMTFLTSNTFAGALPTNPCTGCCDGTPAGPAPTSTQRERGAVHGAFPTWRIHERTALGPRVSCAPFRRSPDHRG